MNSLLDRIRKLGHWQMTITAPVIDHERFFDVSNLHDRFKLICSDIESKFALIPFPMLNISEIYSDEKSNMQLKLDIFSNHRHEVLEHVKVDFSGKVVFNNIFRPFATNRRKTKLLLTNEIVHKILATSLFSRHWANEMDEDSVHVKIEMFGLHGMVISSEDRIFSEIDFDNRIQDYLTRVINFEVSREASTNMIFDQALNISNLICQHFGSFKDSTQALRKFQSSVTIDKARQLATERVNTSQI